MPRLQIPGGNRLPLARSLPALVILAGCAAGQNGPTAQQVANGLIKVLSQSATSPAPANGTANADFRRGIRSIHETELANLFANKPLYQPNGRKAAYPRVAITVDHSFMERFRLPTSRECYFMHARIWHSASSHRDVAPFSVCGQDIQQPPGGFSRADSTLNVWNSGVATAGEDHTGNVRTEGPRYPMRGLPSGPMDAVGSNTTDISYYFIHGALTAMKFDWTQPDPRVWFVKFGQLDDAGLQTLQARSKQAGSASSAPVVASAAKRIDSKTDAASATSTPTGGTTLSYSGMNKLVDGNNDDVTRKRLIGRKVQLTLKAAGPQSLTVNPKDGIFFACKQRSPSFKGGTITATITDFELTPEVDVLVTLDRCQ